MNTTITIKEVKHTQKVLNVKSSGTYFNIHKRNAKISCSIIYTSSHPRLFSERNFLFTLQITKIEME